jgi:hypothetical protein
MAVLRFRAFSETGKVGKADLMIINVFAPTRAQAHPEITESFYHELEQLYQAEKKGTTSVKSRRREIYGQVRQGRK